MKKSTFLLVFFFTTAFFTTAPISADSLPPREPDSATTLRTLEQLKFDAQLHRNSAALDTMLDDGLMWVDEGGTLLTKSSYLQSLHDSSSTHLRIETMKVKVLDRMAIVVGIYDETGVKSGQPYHRHCRFIDTWALKNSKWILIAATATSTIS